jgi:DNA invertase Pin-like site-specific DNA recombinase
MRPREELMSLIEGRLPTASARDELVKLAARLIIEEGLEGEAAGDVLVVTRLDRLARSTRDLLNVLDEVGKRGAGFRSLFSGRSGCAWTCGFARLARD